MGDNPFLKIPKKGPQQLMLGGNSKLGWCGAGGGGELNLYESVRVDIILSKLLKSELFWFFLLQSCAGSSQSMVLALSGWGSTRMHSIPYWACPY